MRLLLPSLLFSAVAATAQPTLTTTTNLPTAGLSNTLYRASSAPSNTVNITGANVTWDFSTLSSSTTASSVYAACPGTAYCDSFPSADLNGLEVLTNNTLFYDTASSKLAIVGTRGSGVGPGTVVNTYYSDPEDFLRFPFTYGNSFNDASRANRIEFGFPARRSGTSTVLADGWGTLKLPGGNNFSNVLRVKRTTTFNDTLDNPIMPVYASGTVTMNLWYSTSYKEWLMLTVTATSPTLGTASAVAWTLPNLAGVKDVSSLACAATPNPAQDRLSIRWASATEATLTLQDLTGRSVLQTSGRGEAAMDVASLPRGMYLLRATDANGAVGTQKILLQ